MSTFYRIPDSAIRIRHIPSASLYQIYRTDTGHDFSLYFAYELLMNFRILFLVHVIIATPGRIYDLIKKELANTKDCQMVVMDEVLYMAGKYYFKLGNYYWFE